MSENTGRNGRSHTPGPWSFEGPHRSIIVYGPEPEQRICFMTSDGPADANARLIAAAPDLLTCVEIALESSGYEHERKIFRAAIAKATSHVSPLCERELSA